MKLKDLILKARTHLDTIIEIGGGISFALALLGKMQTWLKKSLPLLGFAEKNAMLLLVIAGIAYLLLLTSWVFQIHRKFIRGFKDTFHKPLNRSWDYQGEWSILSGKLLKVTNSHFGGITKVGANWENYSFSFKMKIIRKCLGVIVRAVDLNNYYMFQIHSDVIVPHRLVNMPVLPKDQQVSDGIQATNPNSENTINPITFVTGWQLLEAFKTTINPPSNEWRNIRIDCIGESVTIYINDEVVFQEESFIKNPKGKIGFRNHKEETAIVRDVKVRLLS